MSAELRDRVTASLLSVGGVPAAPAPPSELRNRVLSIEPESSTDPAWKLLHMSESAVELSVHRALYGPSHEPVPTQYAVFDVVGRPSFMFSMNVDGLATRYCACCHYVVEPHGRIDDVLVGSTDYEERLVHFAAFDLPLPRRTAHPPIPETPTTIVNPESYFRAERLFLASRGCVVVGYSFGRTDTGMDDTVTFEFLRGLMQRHPVPVFVLMPEPEELVEVLRESLSSYRVHPFATRWEVFAGVVLAFADVRRGLRQEWRDYELIEFLYRHDRRMDV